MKLPGTNCIRKRKKEEKSSKNFPNMKISKLSNKAYFYETNNQKLLCYLDIRRTKRSLKLLFS